MSTLLRTCLDLLRCLPIILSYSSDVRVRRPEGLLIVVNSASLARAEGLRPPCVVAFDTAEGLRSLEVAFVAAEPLRPLDVAFDAAEGLRSLEVALDKPEGLRSSMVTLLSVSLRLFSPGGCGLWGPLRDRIDFRGASAAVVGTMLAFRGLIRDLLRWRKDFRGLAMELLLCRIDFRGKKSDLLLWRRDFLGVTTVTDRRGSDRDWLRWTRDLRGGAAVEFLRCWTDFRGLISDLLRFNRCCRPESFGEELLPREELLPEPSSGLGRRKELSFKDIRLSAMEEGWRSHNVGRNTVGRDNITGDTIAASGGTLISTELRGMGKKTGRVEPRVVITSTLSSMVAPRVVVMICGATIDNKVDILTTSVFTAK